MGQITSNPNISLQANIGAPLIYYFADGAALFGCIGNPEGVIPANKRSIAVSDNGNVYIKTTDALATGWSAIGGGGGSGTVTSIGLTGSSIFDFSGSSANPITTAGSFDIQFASQSANRVFASPSGAPGVPTFRALTSADLSLAAPPPASGIPFNDGANAFTATNGFKFDSASNTQQIGESTVLKGSVQLFAALSAGSVKHTVNNPPSNYVWIWGDSLPANNDLLKVTVSGNNVTIASIAVSALGFASVNPTSGVIPYNNAGSFADSPITRFSSTQIQIPDGAAATPSIRFTTNNTGIFAIGFNLAISRAGAIAYSIGNDQQTAGQALFNNSVTSSSNLAGITWKQAGYVRFTNGSTGIGGFIVGGSTATPVGQAHIINGATGTIPLFIESIGATSVAALKAEISSIQSFAFMPSGKIIGGMNIPTATQQFSAIGNAKSDVSTIGNIGTGNDNLLAFAIGANVLANTGDYAEFDAFGEFAANANNKTLQVVYGGTTIFNTGAVAFNGSNWRINVKILRTGASAGKSIATFWSNDAATPFLQEIFITTESFTASTTVQFKGEGTSNDDITQLHLESKLCVALTS